MLRLYRSQYLLNQQEWTLNIMATHSKDQRVKELLALRQHLSWFATTLKGYVCEVTSIVTRQLTVDLEATVDVDGIVAAFDTFRLNLASKLLQHENLAPIQGSILAILELYEDLALEWRDAVKQISNHAAQPTPRQLVVQQRFSALGDRPEIDETADLTDDEDDEETHRQHDQKSVLSVPSLLKEYNRQLSFLLAGLRSVSRIEGEPAWIMLSERLSWGVLGTDRR
jgi:gamma-tubulin complex component 5